MNDVYKDELTQEWYFSPKRFIMSETDERGIITYASPIFCEMAGYTLDEIIGQPHNIIRHPDMPRAAFADLWKNVQGKGFWDGYVKNLRKDRGFYWVYAMVLRHKDSSGKISYLSIRTVPKREKIAELIPLYQEMKSKE